MRLSKKEKSVSIEVLDRISIDNSKPQPGQTGLT